MRTAVYGSEIAIVDGKIVGFNLGYNFYTEHESEYKVLELIEYLNKQYDMEVSDEVNLKKYNEGMKFTEKYKESPFYNNILRGKLTYLKREIIVDNKKLKKEKKYNKYLLSDGEYTMFYIQKYTRDDFSAKYGRRKKFCEEELLNMTDYNNYNSSNIDTSLLDAKKNVIGSWDNQSFMIFISKSLLGLSDDFENSLKTGSLALSYGCNFLFKDAGLCFLFLDKLCLK